MKGKGKCQSCGMPLKSDPLGGGTSADGSLSSEYCSYCYQDGEFTQPNMTLGEMRALVVKKLGEKGYPKVVGSFFASGLGRLKRWRH